MTDKTMPERIYAWGADDLPRWSRANVVDGAIEYVRADLARGNDNEPLADGQWRWVKVSPDSPWKILHVAPEEDDFYRPALCMHDNDGFFWNEDEVNAIGPVILPPGA